ncbi:hypothetical protein BDN71DRAFT_421773 [Pleurotus eryngii]|uniref:Uncharacterized protein n=1 Tax=Pleurotus eryngii TaxID=5323 RepID=A0A9P6A721_PLEER|nr:hypothetical protein BDN71DRAFT_421773 [Pleurotus eryngii]
MPPSGYLTLPDIQKARLLGGFTSLPYLRKKFQKCPTDIATIEREHTLLITASWVSVRMHKLLPVAMWLPRSLQSTRGVLERVHLAHQSSLLRGRWISTTMSVRGCVATVANKRSWSLRSKTAVRQEHQNSCTPTSPNVDDVTFGLMPRIKRCIVKAAQHWAHRLSTSLGMPIINIPLLRTLPPHFPPTHTHREAARDTPALRLLLPSAYPNRCLTRPASQFPACLEEVATNSTMPLPLFLTLHLPIPGLYPRRIRHTSRTRTTPTLVFRRPETLRSQLSLSMHLELLMTVIGTAARGRTISFPPRILSRI